MNPKFIYKGNEPIGMKLKARNTIEILCEVEDYIRDVEEYAGVERVQEDLYVLKHKNGSKVLTNHPEYFFDAGLSLVLLLKGNDSFNGYLSPDNVEVC